MDIFIIILLGIYYVAMLIGCLLLYYTTFINKKRSVSQVHFYVARDKDGRLCLHIGKPIRTDTVFGSEVSIDLTYRNLYSLGLNKNDFDNLKWEDEPVEVFLKIKC